MTLLMLAASVYLINHFLPARPKEKHQITPGMILTVLCLSVITSSFNFLYEAHLGDLSGLWGADRVHCDDALDLPGQLQSDSWRGNGYGGRRTFNPGKTARQFTRRENGDG
jgi:hypothetical protein